MSTETRHYDLVVLGAGSGNTVVNHEFDDQRVAVVDRGPLGGTCLNRGCIPSKMYVLPATTIAEAQRGPALGVHTSADGVDWPAIRERVLSRIDGVAAQGTEYREKQENVDLYADTARFVGERRLVIGGVEVTADAVVIATGSQPVVPDIPGLHDVPHHTSDSIMRIESLPRRLAIVGGGYVGCEFAHVFSSYGVEVVQVESSSRLLGTQDADIGDRFTEGARERWEVRCGTKLEKAEPHDGGARLHLDDGSTLDVDLVLVAIGRKPSTDELGLETTSVELDDQGRVVVDEQQRTTAPGVWALGDVSSHYPLKHVANAEARTVQHNLLHPDDLVATDHRFVPQAVFSHPQVASVGPTEAQAREQGIDVVVGTADYSQTAYGWALQSDPDDHSPEAEGFVKLLADRATGKLVAAHLVGDQASLLIQPLIQAMSFDLPARELGRGQYWIHPALAEVVEDALLAIEW